MRREAGVVPGELWMCVAQTVVGLALFPGYPLYRALRRIK